jgi:4,5-DOPA dioxygenase extradiol
VLIIGSGFTTHNLSCFDPDKPSDLPAPGWSTDFDHWAREAMAAGDVDALLDFGRRAPASRIAHPRTEHFAPLFIALGASEGQRSHSVIDGFWYGMSKRTWTFES